MDASDEDDCPGCQECLPLPQGMDYSYYSTGIMYPGKKMMHENDPDCWCSPDVFELEDGSVEVIHNVLVQ